MLYRANPGGIAGTMGSSNEGSTTASSDMGSFDQDMLSNVRPDHRDLSMADGWDMDPHDEDCGDQACDAHDNPGVFNEPEPTTRFPGDPYNPPLGQWQGQLLYCTPMSCQGRKEGYVPGDSGDCMGFSMLIEYPPPPPLGQQGVRKSPLYSPSGANPDGHKVPSSKTVAFPPESSGAKTSDNSGGTWEEQIMPGH